MIPVDGRLPGPAGPRYRLVFSDDLVLERIDSKMPGNGLPQSPHARLAGTHSGFATTLRIADANDKFFPEGSMLFQYEGTFMFDAVTADLPTALPRGQVIVRGVAIFDSSFNSLKPMTFAIVGGTGAYEGAGGQVSQVRARRQYPHPQDRVVTARASDQVQRSARIASAANMHSTGDQPVRPTR